MIPPLRYCKIQVTPPHNKTAELASVFEAEIEHPLGLLKVKAINKIPLKTSHIIVICNYV